MRGRTATSATHLRRSRRPKPMLERLEARYLYTAALTGETLVNTDISGVQRTTLDSQAVAVDSTGRAVVVWSGGGTGDAAGVFARRYDAAGNALGSDFRVNTTTAGVQTAASVATDGAGNFVVVWASENQDAAGGYGVYAQRYSAAGAAVGGEFRVNTTTAGDQFQPSVAMHPDGDFVVSWTSYGQDGNGAQGLGVIAQRFNATGNAQGGELIVDVVNTAGDQQHSRVAMDSAGNFTVVWQAYVTSSNSDGIYARRYNAAGTAQPEILINTYTVGDQVHPAIGMNDSGAFVIAWTSVGQDGSAGGTYAQRYTAAGAAAGGEFRVNVTTAGDQYYPSVSMDNAGAFAVAWQAAAQDGSGWGLYAREYTAAGAARGGESLLNATTAGDQVFVSLAAARATGHYVAAWSGNGAGDPDGVFARWFQPADPGVTVTPTAGLTTTEAGGAATFTVVLTSAPTADVSIDLSTSDATEGTVSAARLIFTAANWNTAQTVTVTGVNDAVDDGDVAYAIVTAAAVSADPAYSGMNPADVAVTNTDNDVASIAVSPGSGLVTTEAGGTAAFSVVLTSAPTANVTINLSSSDATEGTISAAALTFTPANWNVAQTVTVTGVNDAFDDGNVAYSIVTAAATSADPVYGGMNAANVSVTNLDDDAAGILVSPTSGLVTTEAGGTATFTVVLAAAPTSNLTIGLSSSDTTEGTVSVAVLTFTSANWNVPQTVTVTGVNDAAHDGDVGYTIVTAPASSADAAFDGMNAADVAATNTDNDPGGVTVTPTTGLVTTEAGGTATFTLVLTVAPLADVTIGLSASNAAEAVLSASGVTFTPANWNVPRTVTVTGVDDAAADGPVAFTVVTSATSSADAGYNGLAVADVSATNQDDDTGLRVTYFDNPDFTGTSVTRFDPTIDFNWAGGSPDPSIGADTFSARWRGEVRPQYGETYTFHTTSDDGVRLWVDGTLVLDNWTDHPSTVNTATITLAAGQWYPIRMELYENAGVAVAKLEWSSTSQARQVVPRARLRPTNVAPSAAGDGYTAGQGGVLAVDAGAGVLANDFDADADPISAVLVSGPAHGSFSLNADGSFTYTPNARFFGTDSFSYRLTDGTASSGVATVTLSVTRTAGITVTPAAGLTTTEAGGAASFSVVLDFAPAAPVTVQLISGAPGEGTLSQSVLTFDAGNWNVPRTVTVTGINDHTADGNVTYAISAAVTSADARYDGLAVPAVGVTNFDMPEPEPEPAGAPPVARDDAYRVDADGTLTVGDRSGVLRNDADPDGSPLTALLLDGPAHGTLTLLPGGGFVYAPEAGFAGVDGFRYVAGDGSDVSAPATVAITIIAADPAPRPVVLPPVTPAPTPSVPPGDNDLPPAPEPADAPAEGKKDDGSTIGVPPASSPPLTAAPARPESAQPDGAGELAHPPVAPPDSLEPAAPHGGKKPVTPVQPGGVPVAPIPDGDDPGFYPESGVPSLAMTRGASASLAVGLDAMSRQIGSRGPSESASVRAVRHTFVAITVGYVVWSLRGASLIASLLTSMPLWRSLDPLPILENRVSAAKRTRRRWFGRPRPGGNPEQPLGEMVK